MGRSDLLLGLRDRRIGKMQERRLDQRQHDEHVHRDVTRQPGGADLFGEPHPPKNLHAARIHALHLGQELRCLLLFDQRAANAAQAEVDREREPDRAGTDDKDLGIHSLFYSTLSVVVPAKAGRPITTEPRSMSHPPSLIARQGVWVPAFAGTTPNVYR